MKRNIKQEALNIIDNVLKSYIGAIDTDVIIIPEGTVAIADNVFHRNCHGESVKSLYLPSSLESIGDSAFAGLSNLEEIIVSESNVCFNVKDNCLIEKSTNTLIFATVKCESIPDCEIIANWGACNIHTNNTLYIPPSVKVIGKCAFRGAEFYNLVFLGNAPQIGAYSFADCHNLKFVTLPKDIKIIPNHMFCNDSGLHHIDLPGTVEIIDHCAFYNCDLFSLTVPKSTKYISDSIVSDVFSNCHIDTVTFEDTEGWHLCSRAESYEEALLLAQNNKKLNSSAYSAAGIETLCNIVPVDVTNAENNAKIINWYDLKYLIKL